MTGAQAQRPVVIGLAGGIGAGKSTVAAAFASLGCVVSDSDAQARECLTRPEVAAQLVSWWGPRVLDASGGVDRRAVAAIVFADPQARARLEALIHPLIRASRDELIGRARAAGAPAVIVDAPLLFEAGLDGDCDAVVFVEAPRADRVERVRATRGWDEAELTRREAAQWPEDDKRRGSTHRIENRSADREGLVAAARAILDDVRRRGLDRG